MTEQDEDTIDIHDDEADDTVEPANDEVKEP